MKKKRPTRRPWTRAELAEFRHLAKQGLSGAQIAKKLRRTKGAVYQRGTADRIRLRSRQHKRR